MIVLDTHALVWWLSEPRKLSSTARRALRQTAAGGETISASAISLFEIRSLIQRDRLRLGVDPDAWFAALRSLPELSIEAVSAGIAWTAGDFGPEFPGDPADRMIAATARVLGGPLVTADEKLRASQAIETIW